MEFFKRILVACLLVLLSGKIIAQDLTVVAVGDASPEKERLLFVDHTSFSSSDESLKKMSEELNRLFRNDFSYYRAKFEIVSRSNHDISMSAKPDYSMLRSLKIQYAIFVKTAKVPSKDGNLSIDIMIYRVADQSVVLAITEKCSSIDLRRTGHDLADRMFKAITGTPSMFKSFIIFVSDLISQKSMKLKELYMMDFDGQNKRRLTHHLGTVISPTISSDNRYILYSMVKDKVSKERNVDLYLYDLKTEKTRILSSRRGINSGAVFMPDGKHIALTLSHADNAEIYEMDLQDGSLRGITKHFAIDVDPSVNKEGSLMAFLSSRPGQAHIYILDPRGVEKDVMRVSFVGQFNATPRFSPDGNQIAFASWMDERFDIFRIDSTRKNLVRLTKDFGSNEDPTWSPDGQFIAFSSQRVISRQKAVHNIYIMDRDGEIIGPITRDYGNCITPSWSN